MAKKKKLVEEEPVSKEELIDVLCKKKSIFFNFSCLKRFFSSKTFLLIFFVVIIILGIILSLLFSRNLNFCGDGTLEGECSVNKPYFCLENVLIQDEVDCGCFEESCFSDYFVEPKEAIFPYTLKGKKGEIKIVLYERVYDYVSTIPRILRASNDFIPKRIDFKMNKLGDFIQREAILPLIVEIQNIAPNSKEDQARITISLVQNIQYNESEEVVLFNNISLRISRFPYQTLYDNAAACEGKSELLALLLKEIGYGVSLFYYGPENHEVIGIECPVEKSFNETGYCFVETTSPSIIGDNQGEYIGFGKLFSEPEITVLFDGISLKNSLKEYGDAESFMKLRKETSFNPYERWRFNQLKKHYGLNVYLN